MEKTYALIKDSVVINTVIVEEDNIDLINAIKEIHENPEIVEIPLEKNVEVNYVYNGEDFIDPNYVEPFNIEESSEIIVELEDLDGIMKPD
jgi:hypothetical protein